VFDGDNGLYQLVTDYEKKLYRITDRAKNMTRYCKICGSELPEEFPTDICLDCQSIMSQDNFFKR
jgi:hypothetical protein